jgi:hypothetical protein
LNGRKHTVLLPLCLRRLWRACGADASHPPEPSPYEIASATNASKPIGVLSLIVRRFQPARDQLPDGWASGSVSTGDERPIAIGGAALADARDGERDRNA